MDHYNPAPPMGSLPDPHLALNGERFAEQSITMVTPEAVQLDLPVAGVPSRTLARLVDMLIQGMLVSLFFYIAAMVSAGSATVSAYVGLGGLLVTLIGYPVAMETLTKGRTVGKMAVGLRVVTSQGGPVRFRHALLRALVGAFEIYGTSGMVAVVSAFFTPRAQRLGDLAAGTFVVNERVGERRSVPVVFPCPAGYEEFVRQLDVGRVSDQQYGVIRAFLMRATSLSHAHRYSLGAMLGDRLLATLNMNLSAEMNPETFLVCVCCAYQRRSGGLAAVGWAQFDNATYIAPS